MSGLPTNSSKAKTKGCSPVSSNCVVWQGQSLPCIDLCTGDTVSDVVFKLATELCTLMTMFDISNYDLECLNVSVLDRPTDMKGFIEILMARICALEGLSTAATTEASDCPTGCIVDIAPCLQYNDQNGTLVTSTNLYEYVLLIANQVCTNVTDIITIEGNIATLQTDVLANTGNIATNTVGKADITSLDYTVSTKTNPATGTVFITEALTEVENSLIKTQDASGSNTDLISAIGKDLGISTENRLATAGTLASSTGWINPPSTVAESLGNLWITVRDIRAALVNIVNNAATESCATLLLNYTTTFNTATSDLVLFTSGSTGFTGNWSNCNLAIVTVSDALGNTVTYNKDLITLIGVPAGETENLLALGLDLTTDISTNVEACFTNSSNGVTCNNTYSSTHVIAAPCPAVVLTPNTTWIDYDITITVGYSYRINLYDDGGLLVIDSKAFNAPVANIVDKFSALAGLTTFDVEVIVINGAGVETACPKQSATTL